MNLTADQTEPFRSTDDTTGDVLLTTVYLFKQAFHAFAVRVDTEGEQTAANDPFDRLNGLYEGDDPGEAYDTIEGVELGGDAIPDAEYVVWFIPHG